MYIRHHVIKFSTTENLKLSFCFQAVEALEVMILSILSAILKCEWELSYAEEALITTVRFVYFK